MKSKAITLKIFFLIVVNDLGDSVAQLFMKKGLVQTGINSIGFGNLAEFISRNAASSLVWLGIFVYTVNFFLWIVILSRVDLSVAMPVGSTSYLTAPFMAMIFLNEKVGLLRWAGILLIILGIHFVSQSAQSHPARIHSS